MTHTETDAAIEHVYEQWHETIKKRDLDGLMALYAEDAVLETPLIVATRGPGVEGILRGKSNIRLFFEEGLRRVQGNLGQWYRTGLFFSNGKQLIWEYPRQTPTGNQVDLVEVMDISNGLITHHRVYWGWVGFEALLAIAKKGPA